MSGPAMASNWKALDDDGVLLLGKNATLKVHTNHRFRRPEHFGWVVPQFLGEWLFGEELHHLWDIDFLKGNDMWNSMAASKKPFVGTTYNIKSQKTNLGTKTEWFKNCMNSYVPRHGFKKINVKIFIKFQKNFSNFIQKILRIFV